MNKRSMRILGFYQIQHMLVRLAPSRLSKEIARRLKPMSDAEAIDRQLTDTEEAANMQQTLDDVLKVMACHAAIRAHHHLQDAQITALLQQMDDLDLPYSCPHGRPTVLKISLADLEKKFGRTGN